MTNKEFKEKFRQRIYQWVLRLLKFIDGIPRAPTARVLNDQLIRSGTSVLGNYVEAQASSSRKEFTNFFFHSLKSANESGLWLTLLRDAAQCDKKEVEYLIAELDEIARIFSSSILTLKGQLKVKNEK